MYVYGTITVMSNKIIDFIYLPVIQTEFLACSSILQHNQVADWLPSRYMEAAKCSFAGV